LKKSLVDGKENLTEIRVVVGSIAFLPSLVSWYWRNSMISFDSVSFVGGSVCKYCGITKINKDLPVTMRKDFSIPAPGFDRLL
jgi:hypothetical protein